MYTEKVIDFRSLVKNVGKFDLRNKTVLVPEMATMGSHVLAAVFRGFGINAQVLKTFEGMDLGMEYTSGKECYPCQITMGDILSFLLNEKDKKGPAFDADDYVYFMPEANGPCRFGMYNKYQRIVLDSFPEFQDVRIGAITTGDGYSLKGVIEEKYVTALRKSAFLSVVITDILDRLLWRIRPYEKEPGMADALMDQAMPKMEAEFVEYAVDMNFKMMLNKLEEIMAQGKSIIDPDAPVKPLIGVVGEIYLRTHTHANQDLIRVLERYGAEVVNASVTEWVNYTAYEGLRAAKKRFRMNVRQFRLNALRKDLEDIIGFGGKLMYQEFWQKKVFKRARKHLDIAGDHKVSHLEALVKKQDSYNFDLGTEACLSIAGIQQYADEGYNGVVNVYPFTCMPSTITAAIAKPVMNKRRIPYLDTPFDASSQPGRETAIRTFMYQAQQHLRRNGRKSH